MPIQFNPDTSGTTLEVHVSGKIVKEDYEKFVPEFDELVCLHGKQRVLFDMTGLEGWEPAALWEDVKFGFKHFSDIERLAMVGDKRWEHVMSEIWKPFTKAKVQYFDHGDTESARKWLDET